MKYKLILITMLLLLVVNVHALGEATIKNVKINNQAMECIESICSGETASDEFQVTFELTDPLATVEGFSSGETHLINGEKTTLSLKVTNGDNIFTYNFLITKRVKSSDNSLSKLVLLDEEIKVSKNVYVYNANVPYDTKEIKFEATPKDSHAKVIYPKDLSFPEDRSTKSFDFTIKAEDDKEQDYRLVIVRDEKPNLTLKSIKLSAGIVELKKDVFDYDVNVSYDTNTIMVEAYANDSKAKVSINKKEYLEIGDNKITITVEIKDLKQEYHINVKRLENVDENIVNIANVTIKEYSKLNFVSSNLNYDLYFKEIPSKLTIDIELANDKAKEEIIGNENLKDGSVITLKSSIKDLNLLKEYKLTIHQEPEEEVNKTLILILIIILVIVIIVMFIIELKSKKKKKVSKKKVKEEELEEI